MAEKKEENKGQPRQQPNRQKGVSGYLKSKHQTTKELNEAFNYQKPKKKDSDNSDKK